MLRFTVKGRAAAIMLLLVMAGSARAQDPHTRSQASVVQRLADSSGAPAAMSRIRELVCRGKPGIAMRVQQEPSPRDPNAVAMVLRYQRLPETILVRPDGTGSADYGRTIQLTPGSCSWNRSGLANIPPEPGEVLFDLPRDAQRHLSPSARDTTIDVAVNFPDVVSLPRFMSDSNRYWVFYVDDVSNISISSARWPLGGGLPPISYGSGIQPAPASAPAGSFGGTLRGSTTTGIAARSTTSDAAAMLRMAELRCRGGAGLGFAPGASAGENQVLMTLSYPVSPAVPGATGRGLAPGSCAWADRTGLAREPGTVVFVTAGNAQLSQARHGSTVDRSPTAAERWPDVHTIPVYLSDPGRFWRFTIVMVDSDSARQHGPWKPSLTDAIAGPVTEAPSTRTMTESPVTAGRTVDSSRSSLAFDPFAVRRIVITPSVNGVTMKFEGPSVTPLVQVSTLPPFRESSGRWTFSPDHLSLRVARASTDGANAFSAASTTPLLRNTEYHYLINAPKPAVTDGTLNRHRREGGDRQAVGTFRTLRTDVRVWIDKVHIIDDSDDGGSGELYFTFTVNDAEQFNAGTILAEVSPNTALELDDGESYEFKRDIVQENAPGRLRIQAAGFDNDGVFGGKFDASWNATAGGDGGGDWNHARAEFELDQYPGRTFDFPLRMRTGPGSKLQFEVEGHVTVTRE
jgi:hypothetical protein